MALEGLELWAWALLRLICSPFPAYLLDIPALGAFYLYLPHLALHKQATALLTAYLFNIKALNTKLPHLHPTISQVHM